MKIISTARGPSCNDPLELTSKVFGRDSPSRVTGCVSEDQHSWCGGAPQGWPPWKVSITS